MARTLTSKYQLERSANLVPEQCTSAAIDFQGLSASGSRQCVPFPVIIFRVRKQSGQNLPDVTRIVGVMDRLLAPYNAAAFGRFARRYADGPRLSRFYGILNMALAIMMFVGACMFFAVAAKQHYLNAYGVEVRGKILDVSFHTDSYGRHTRWKKLDYEFAASSGDVIKGRLDRPVHELTNLPEGDRFTVLYWDRFPNINSPRGMQSNVGINAFLAGILSLGWLHFGCLSRRLFRWRNDLIAAAARSNH
jgi:hypothetical protein